jgi:tetratricopeptide (TPR) repeat protein
MRIGSLFLTVALASVLTTPAWGRGFGGGGGFRGGGGFGGGGFRGGGGFGGGRGFSGGSIGGGNFNRGNFGGGNFAGRDFGGRDFGGGGFSGGGQSAPSFSRPSGGGSGFNHYATWGDNGFRPSNQGSSNRGDFNRGDSNRGNFNRGNFDNNVVNRGNINRGNTNIGNNVNRNDFNNHWNQWHSNWNHDWQHGRWNGNWDHDWHNHWNNWWSNPWYARPAFWGVTGWALGAAAYDWGFYPYVNPYAVAPVVVGPTTIDYSQPLETSYAAPGGDGSEANTAIGQARQAFYDQDYQTALAKSEQAIAKTPGDPNLHEFRALVLFAMKRYRDAAAAVYSIVSIGPGWDWTTVSELYSDPDIYTRQLRALEDYVRQNPNAADARFLLAYQYMTCSHTDAAIRQLQQVVKLNPNDRVSAQLLSMLTQGQDQSTEQLEQVSPPAAPSKPIDAAALVGDWRASPDNQSSISLALGKDSKFNWKFTRDGQAHDFSGTYTISDNLLIMQPSKGGDPMVGRLVPDQNGFRFQLVGGPPGDQGLAFRQAG